VTIWSSSLRGNERSFEVVDSAWTDSSGARCPPRLNQDTMEDLISFTIFLADFDVSAHHFTEHR